MTNFLFKVILRLIHYDDDGLDGMCGHHCIWRRRGQYRKGWGLLLKPTFDKFH